MNKFWKEWKWLPMVLVGCLIVAVGFDMFLLPNGINGGGLSGLAMVLVEWTGLGTVGMVSIIMNIPLFIIGGRKIGKKFFFGSLVGMVSMSLLIDFFDFICLPEIDPLLCSLYGGVMIGLGMGLVFMSGVSSGGSDIIVRLVKLSYPNFSIGTITLSMDLAIAALTGIVFKDFTRTLYSILVLVVCSKVIDMVLYSFDYSKVALIISAKHDAIADAISEKLDRGVTFLNGQGYYRKQEMKVILTAIKRRQMAELKELVSEIDPNAFVILQEAHQVLGDGFRRYSKDDL